MASAALVTGLRMTEVRGRAAGATTFSTATAAAALREITRQTFESARWILTTPFALVVMVAGVTFDSIIRLFLTLNSQYYRAIELPEASFGVIGSALSLLGLVIPSWSRRLVNRRSPRFNLGLTACMTVAGLWGLTWIAPWWGWRPWSFSSPGCSWWAFS